MQGHEIDTTEHRLLTANKAASMALHDTTLEAKKKEGLALPFSSPYLLSPTIAGAIRTLRVSKR
jgi:hypothetical protein